MTTRKKGGSSGDGEQARYPDTVAPLQPDTSSWVMKSIGGLESEVTSLGKMIDSVDKKIDGLAGDLKGVAEENKKHAKFIHAATIISVICFAILGFFGGRIWDLIMEGIQAKFRSPTP